MSPPPSQPVAPVQPLATRGVWDAAIPLAAPKATPAADQPAAKAKAVGPVPARFPTPDSDHSSENPWLCLESPRELVARKAQQRAATSSGQPLAVIPDSAAQPPPPPAAQAAATSSDQPLAVLPDPRAPPPRLRWVEAHEAEDNSDQGIVNLMDMVNVGSDNDITDVERENAATGSEVEELARLREIRSQRRKTRAHYRIGKNRGHGRFEKPAVGGGGQEPEPAVGGFHDIEHWAKRSATWVGEAEYCRVTWCFPEGGGGQRSYNFLQDYNYRAIGARHALFRRLREPAIGGRDGEHGWEALLSRLPDTDGDGEQEIWPGDFASRWNNDPCELLKHLFNKHEGSIVEVEADWSGLRHGQPLAALIPSFDEPQFALDWRQFQEANSRLRRNTGSLYIPRPNKGKGRGKGPAVGGKGKGKECDKGGKGPAVGGKGKECDKGGFTNKTANRVLKITGGNDDSVEYQVREGWVVSLPELVYELGKWYSARELYRYFCSRPELAVKRQHAWASDVRRAAAVLRKEETGFYGFGRGNWGPWGNGDGDDA